MKIGWLQRLMEVVGISTAYGNVAHLGAGRTSIVSSTPSSDRSAIFGPDLMTGLKSDFRRHRGAIALTCLSAFLGVFLVAQWQSRIDAPVAAAASRPALTRETIQRLEAEQQYLKQQIAQLRADNANQQQRASKDASALAQIGDAVAQQRAIAGTVPLRGSGIAILLDDSTSRTLLPSQSADDYIVHEYQIRDVVNLLWSSGALGIAVNGERFVNTTSVYCVGSTILINDTRTSPPYDIIAVGDIGQMQDAFNDGTALRDLKGRVQAFGLVLKIGKSGTFTLPAFDGSISMRHTASQPDYPP